MAPAPPRMQPALFGGLFIGVLSALPLVNFANCCCLWVIGGGVLAAYLMQQNFPYAVSAADGALVGLLAGAFGGILGALLSVPVEMAMGPLQQRWIERLILSNPDVPEETRTMIENMAARGQSGLVFVIRMVFGTVLGAIFGMLGGLLGVALFKKGEPPPAQPPGTVEILPPEQP
jgi:hypothetical protein